MNRLIAASLSCCLLTLASGSAAEAGYIKKGLRKTDAGVKKGIYHTDKGVKKVIRHTNKFIKKVI